VKKASTGRVRTLLKPLAVKSRTHDRKNVPCRGRELMHHAHIAQTILLAVVLGVISIACDPQQVEGEQHDVSHSKSQAPNPARTTINDIAEEQGFRFTKDWTSKHRELWTKQLAPLRGKPRLQMLEVGTFEGRSAIWFLDNILTHGTSTITCVDVLVDERLEDRFDHNIKVSGHGAKVRKIKDFSQRALGTLEPRSFDIIYIDGCHSPHCVFIDTAYSWELLKAGGYLVFDDYGGQQEKPKRIIDPFLAAFAGYIEVLHKDYQVILRKTGHAY